MSKPKYLLIDGNALGYAQQLGMSRLSCGDQPTHAIYGFMVTLRNLVIPKDGQMRKPIVLWDGDASWRKEELTEYKANRKDDPKKIKIKDEYHSQTPFIRELLIHLGIDQMLSTTCEADDLAGAYSRILAAKGYNVELITGDQDWLQLVSPRVSWFDPIRDRFVDVMTFEDFTGYPTPNKFLAAKCLMGDSSDNIPGVGGIGKVGAQKLLTEYDSVAEFLALEELPKKVPKAWRELYEGGEKLERYKRNIRLMKLDGTHPTIKDRTIKAGRWNPEGFETLAQDLAFFSITKNLENWLKPFAEAVKA